jgi:hypothetical protein
LSGKVGAMAVTTSTVLVLVLLLLEWGLCVGGCYELRLWRAWEEWVSVVPSYNVLAVDSVYVAKLL